MHTPSEHTVIEWWLDESALPELHWARLTVLHNGHCEVFDMDGNTHSFTSPTDARSFLTEDEYLPYLHLVHEELIDSGIQPPHSSLQETELMQAMKPQRSK